MSGVKPDRAVPAKMLPELPFIASCCLLVCHQRRKEPEGQTRVITQRSVFVYHWRCGDDQQTPETDIVPAQTSPRGPAADLARSIIRA